MTTIRNSPKDEIHQWLTRNFEPAPDYAKFREWAEFGRMICDCSFRENGATICVFRDVLKELFGEPGIYIEAYRIDGYMPQRLEGYMYRCRRITAQVTTRNLSR